MESDDVDIISQVVDRIPYSSEIQSFIEVKNPNFVSNFSLDELNTLCKSFVYLGLDVDVRIFEEVFWHAARSGTNVFIKKKNQEICDDNFEWRTEHLELHYFLWKCIDKDWNVLLKLAISQTTCECDIAAKRGNLRLLQFLRESGFNWNEWTCQMAAEHGHLEVLKWARDHGCPWDTRTCAKASLNGHLEILQWARQNGCAWDEWTCAYAARNGNLEILQWLRNNLCPWDEWTCSTAAAHGHLNVLQWAKQNGCPWDKWTCIYASHNGQVDVLHWARHNGCPE